MTEATHAVSASHVYANDGALIVTVTVRDVAGDTAQDQTTVTVSNVLPTANAQGPYSGRSRSADRLQRQRDRSWRRRAGLRMGLRRTMASPSTRTVRSVDSTHLSSGR